MATLLYIRPGYVPAEKDERRNVFSFLSKDHEGFVLSPRWGNKSEGRTYSVGSFTYYYTYSFTLPRVVRILWDMSFMIAMGVYLHYFRKRIDVIVSYGTNKTGITALALRILTGARFIAEVPGNPAAAYIFDVAEPGLSTRIKHWRSKVLFSTLIRFADHLKLLYPTQLEAFPSAQKLPASIFHDFLGISSMVPSDKDDNYLLCMGTPWYLKGVDLLIEAFKEIQSEFPELRLRIIGSAPDRPYFEALVEGEERIELRKGVSYAEAINNISRCTLFVLPSRTEAMGKVLLESMAHQRPIVAARVDGIPFYVEDETSGLLFESENANEVANALRRTLNDDNFRNMMAENGRHRALSRYSEHAYVREFNKMIDLVLKKSSSHS